MPLSEASATLDRMTNSYQGPVVVLMGGREHYANADLSIHIESGLKSWDGTLESDPSLDWFDAADGDEARLRMPDGREGQFFATAGSLGSGQVEIQGSGPAPFGDSA
ncbi:protein of unknown function [Streptomyces sp. Termitarium-T10T-6]|nr:protein of unknown function [Streptomyces sp. Termitarium-T10T-6]